MENYADLSVLLFPELLAAAGAPATTGLNQLQQFNSESPKVDFLTLLSQGEESVPVLPAHIPPPRQSLPVGGQLLPLSGLMSLSPAVVPSQSVMVKQLDGEPVQTRQPGARIALAAEQAAEAPSIKLPVTPRLEPVRPPPAHQPPPQPIGELGSELAAKGIPVETPPLVATPAPVRPPPSPAVPAAATNPLVDRDLPSGIHAPVTDTPKPAVVTPEPFDIPELARPERLPTTPATPVPSVAAVTVAGANPIELPPPVQQNPASTPAQLPEQIADSVRMLATRQGGEMRLRLNPPELGHLEVKVTINDEQTFVSITASNSLSRDVLEQHLGRLRSLLDDAGLNLADAQVSSERQSKDRTAQPPVESMGVLTADSPPETDSVDSAPRSSQHGVDLFA